MDERMEELGSFFFSDFLRNTCGRKSICFEQIFFFAPGFSSPGTSQREKKKVLTFPLRGEREEHSEGEMKKDKKRKEKKRAGNVDDLLISVP